MLWVEIINQYLTNMLSNKICLLYDSFCYVSLIFLWSKLSNSASISDYPINSQSFSVLGEKKKQHYFIKSFIELKMHSFFILYFFHKESFKNQI